MVRLKKKQKPEDSVLPPFPQMQAPPGVIANSLRRADIKKAARMVGLPKLTEAMRLAADHLHRSAYENAYPGREYNPFDLTVPRPTKEFTQGFGVYVLQQRYTLEHYMQEQTPYYQSCVHALHQICEPFWQGLLNLTPPIADPWLAISNSRRLHQPLALATPVAHRWMVHQPRHLHLL